MSNLKEMKGSNRAWLGAPPMRDRILEQHSVGRRGLGGENPCCGEAGRGELGRGCRKQLCWLSSWWGDGARLVSAEGAPGLTLLHTGAMPLKDRQNLPSGQGCTEK